MGTAFLHIRKTGGTAMRHALKPLAPDYDLRLARHGTILPHIPPGSHKVVFTVRDPVRRFVSGFNSRFRKGQPRHYREWSESEQWAFERFQTPNALAEALETDRAEAEKAMMRIDHVRHRMSDWLGAPDYLDRRRNDILFICHQPDLDQDFETVKRLLGLPGHIDLPRDPVAAHATPDGFARHLSEAGEKQIREWYAHDLKLYEHCLRMRDKMLETSRLDDGDTIARQEAR